MAYRGLEATGTVLSADTPQRILSPFSRGFDFALNLLDPAPRILSLLYASRCFTYCRGISSGCQRRNPRGAPHPSRTDIAARPYSGADFEVRPDLVPVSR